MQNVCVGEKHARFFQYNNSDLLHEVNKVIDANENNLVIYIKNVMKKNLINKFAPFHAYEGTEDVDFAKELHIVSDNIFIKYKGNAFTNSGLDILLKKHNIEYVEVVGVDGGACVALTAFIDRLLYVLVSFGIVLLVGIPIAIPVSKAVGILFGMPNLSYQFPTMQIGGYLLILILLQLILSVWEIRDLKKRSLTEQMRAME